MSKRPSPLSPQKTKQILDFMVREFPAYDRDSEVNALAVTCLSTALGVILGWRLYQQGENHLDKAKRYAVRQMDYMAHETASIARQKKRAVDDANKQ